MNKIVIAPNSYHQHLRESYRKDDPFFDVKFYSLEDIKKNVLGELSDKAFEEIIKETGINPELLQEQFEYVPYIEKDYINLKLNVLYQLKNALIDDKLIKKDDMFSYFLKGKNVDIYGYSKNNYDLNKMINLLSLKPTYFKENTSKEGRACLIFSSVDEECHYVCYEIIRLIKEENVDINDIYIIGADETYLFNLKHFAKSYGIPIKNLKGEAKTNTPYYKYFIYDFLSSENIESTIEKCDDYFLDDETWKDELKDEILSLYDEDFDTLTFISYLSYKLSKEYMSHPIYDNGITLLDKPTYLKDKYVFVLGFAQDRFPQYKDDNDYLNNKEKEMISYPTSRDINKSRKDELLDFFLSDNKFYFSYSIKSFSSNFYPSFLIENLGLVVTNFKGFKNDYDIKASRVELAKMLDIKRKYHEQKPLLKSYSEKIDIKYNTYDNVFTPTSVYNSFSRLSYSYSMLDKYFSCPFSFYLNRVLKIDDGESMYINRGIMFHSILEEYIHGGRDFDDIWNEHRGDFDFSLQDGLVLDSLKDSLKIACETAENQLKQFDNIYTDTEISLGFDIDKNTHIEGKIDKLMILNDQYVVVVDYKTGNAKFDPKLIPYRESLQLPVYALLLKCDERFEDYDIGGLYINSLISKDKNLTKKADPSEPTYLKLHGITLSDMDFISVFDPDYGPLYPYGRYVALPKIKADNTISDSKTTVSAEVINSYCNEALEAFKELDDGLRNNKFDIAPRKIGNHSLPCQYCGFKEICNVKEEQIVKVDIEDEQVE